MEHKKSQIWFTDFMVGILIFVIVIFIYYEFAYDVSQYPEEKTADLLMEAKSIASSLMMSGSPTDWNSSNVMIIGLTDGNQRFVQQKLNSFYSMNYSYAKSKLRTPYNLYLYLEDTNGTVIPISGKSYVGVPSNISSDVVSIRRIGIYNSSMVSMAVQVWT